MDFKNFLMNFTKKLENISNKKIIIKIGFFEGEMYLGDEKYDIINGDLFMTINNGNLFEVRTDNNECYYFDVFNDLDIIRIDL